MKIWLPEELEFLRNSRKEHQTTVEKMTNKTVILSGGTSGVGLEALHQFVQGGAHVVLVARNPEKAKRIQQEIKEQYDTLIDIVICDFSDLEDVRKAANNIIKQYDTIDVIVNSVGIYNTKKRFTKEGYEEVFCVNHLAVFLFTYLLLDKLQASAPSRIIQVNSEGHRFGGLRVHNPNWKWRFYIGLRGYGASKVAQLLTTWEFADRLDGTGVTINAMHPGAVKTNIGQNNGWLYRFWFRHVTSKILKDPVIAGESIYYLAASPKLKTVSGDFFNLTTKEKPAWHTLSRKKSKRMWAVSMDLTGLASKE